MTLVEAKAIVAQKDTSTDEKKKKYFEALKTIIALSLKRPN
jgi:hypothetical protein